MLPSTTGKRSCIRSPDLKPPGFPVGDLCKRALCPCCSIAGAVPPRAQRSTRTQREKGAEPSPPARLPTGTEVPKKRDARVEVARSGQGRESKPAGKDATLETPGTHQGAELRCSTPALRVVLAGHALEVNRDAAAQPAPSFPLTPPHLQRDHRQQTQRTGQTCSCCGARA